MEACLHLFTSLLFVPEFGFYSGPILFCLFEAGRKNLVFLACLLALLVESGYLCNEILDGGLQPLPLVMFLLVELLVFPER
jgi:hypothetical protein